MPPRAGFMSDELTVHAGSAAQPAEPGSEKWPDANSLMRKRLRYAQAARDEFLETYT
jgi:hypothetical protein